MISSGTEKTFVLVYFYFLFFLVYLFILRESVCVNTHRHTYAQVGEGQREGERKNISRVHAQFRARGGAQSQEP